MTPERAEAVLRGVVSSLQGFEDELALIDAMRPVPTPAVQHLLGCMRQCRLSLIHLLERDEPLH